MENHKKSDLELALKSVAMASIALTPIIGDVCIHKFFSHQRAKVKERKKFIQEQKLKGEEDNTLKIYEQNVEYADFISSKLAEGAFYLAKGYVYGFLFMGYASYYGWI